MSGGIIKGNLSSYEDEKLEMVLFKILGWVSTENSLLLRCCFWYSWLSYSEMLT
jgi:hypothetical protein